MCPLPEFLLPQSIPLQWLVLLTNAPVMLGMPDQSLASGILPSLSNGIPT